MLVLWVQTGCEYVAFISIRRVRTQTVDWSVCVCAGNYMAVIESSSPSVSDE